MVREPDATMQPTLQDNQLMSKHRVLGFKPQLRLEWRGQDGQNETKQPDHSASLGDFFTSSTRIRFSVHTTVLSKRSAKIRLRQCGLSSTFAERMASSANDMRDSRRLAIDYSRFRDSKDHRRSSVRRRLTIEAALGCDEAATEDSKSRRRCEKSATASYVGMIRNP